MKTTHLAAACLSAVLLLPAARAAEPRRDLLAAAEVKPVDARMIIPVDGMHCGDCVNSVASHLKQLPGVKAVDVDLEKKRATVTYEAAKVTAKAMVDAIREAGYQPGVPVAG